MELLSLELFHLVLVSHYRLVFHCHLQLVLHLIELLLHVFLKRVLAF